MAVLVKPAAAVQTTSSVGREASAGEALSARAGAPAESGPSREPGIPRNTRRTVLVVGSVAVPLIAITALGVGWWLWKSDGRQEQHEVQVQAPVPPAPAEPPAVSADEVEAVMQQAAAEAARRLDGEYRVAHSAKQLIEPAQLNAEMIRALAQGNLDAIPESLPGEPAPDSSASYQSLYDSLHAEALAYLKENVSREDFSKQSVLDAARRWEEGKRVLLEKQLTEKLQEYLAPGRR